MTNTIAPALLIVLILLAACQGRPSIESPILPIPVITGLNLPRGLTFDDVGDLFVTEAGLQAADELTNHSGRILEITSNHQVNIRATDLPFAYLPSLGTGVGATDVVTLAGSLYVLTGEGPDPLSRAILRIVSGEPPIPVASILNFAAYGLTSDLIHSGVVRANPYAMVAAPDGRSLYVADGASGRVLHVTLDGTIQTFVELPDSQPLAGLVFGPDGNLYFTALSPLPHTPGSGEVWAASPTGKRSLVLTGLTMPIDVGFDAVGSMYVLEFGDGRRPQVPYAADTGRLLRIETDGTRTVVLDHLNYPTSMAFSHAGDLYIAVGGAFTASRNGSVVEIKCFTLGIKTACS